MIKKLIDKRIFLLAILFGSALFGGINTHLPLIDSDLPLVSVLCIIFTGAFIIILKNNSRESLGNVQKRNVFTNQSNSLPFFPVVLYGGILLGLLFFTPCLRLSYLEFLKYFACMLFLFLTWRYISLFPSKQLNFILAYILVIDGIAVLNLLSWFLRIPSQTFYGYDPGTGRLFGTMLYCNSAAAFLIPVLFIHLAFIILTPLRLNKFFHSMGATLCMLNIVLSLSRGTEVIMCGIYFFIIFFMKKSHRWKTFWILFVLENTTLLLLPSLMNLYYACRIYSLSIVIISSICLVSYFIAYILPKIIDYLSRKRYFNTKKYQIVFISILIIAGLILPFWKLPQLAWKLPQLASDNTVHTRWVGKRAKDWAPVISAGKIRSYDESADLRIETFRFAGNMFLSKPWIGFGPGIYPLAYLQYRTFDYPWNSPHALLLEKPVESGILGFFGFIILMGIFFKRVVLEVFYSGNYLLRILACSIVALFGHVCLDKDWDYYAMQLDFWLLVGLTLAYYQHYMSRRENFKESAIGTSLRKNSFFRKVFCTPITPFNKGDWSLCTRTPGHRFYSWLVNRTWHRVFLCLLAILTIHIWLLFTGGICIQLARSFAGKNDFKNAVRWTVAATKFDRLNANYFIEAARYGIARGLVESQPVLNSTSAFSFTTGGIISGFSQDFRQLREYSMLSRSEINAVKSWLEEALRLCPLLPAAYYEMSRFYWLQGNKFRAEYYWKELKKIDPLGMYSLWQNI